MMKERNDEGKTSERNRRIDLQQIKREKRELVGILF